MRRIGRELKARLCDPALALYVAYADGRPVASARAEFPRDRSFAGLWGGGTIPEYRGRGIYRALVHARARRIQSQSVYPPARFWSKALPQLYARYVSVLKHVEQQAGKQDRRGLSVLAQHLRHCERVAEAVLVATRARPVSLLDEGLGLVALSLPRDGLAHGWKIVALLPG